MTLDLTGILCSIRVLNPSVREGALAFLFARTNTSYQPAKVTSLPKWDARYSSFVFSWVFTSAGLHIPYVPLPCFRHSFSNHTKHSRFSCLRLTPTTELLCEHWQTDNLVGSAGAPAEGGECRKSKREVWNLKKNNPASKGADEKYAQQRVITKTLGLSSNGTGGTNLQQPGNHGHGSTQQRAFSWPCACTPTPPQLQC